MKFIILVSINLTQRFLLKKRLYKKLRCNSTVKIRFGRKKILNYAYVQKNGVRRYNIFFLIFTQSLLNPPFCVVFVQNPSMFLSVPCAFSSTSNFAHAQTLYRMSSLCRSYEYCVGKHWNLGWMEENQTATYFLRSRLFTYDIMKNFNCNQYKTLNIGNF